MTAGRQPSSLSLSAGAPHSVTTMVLKKQHPTFCAQQQQFSITGRRQCLVHTQEEEWFNAAWLAGTNDRVCIHPLRGAKRVYKGRTLCMSVVCPAECYL